MSLSFLFFLFVLIKRKKNRTNAKRKEVGEEIIGLRLGLELDK